MKCPNCGAEVGNSNFCEFCGTQISFSMRREQEQLNKRGCPKCGSSNITFTRENQGELHGKNTKRVINRTVGFCQDCGHTWYPEMAMAAPYVAPSQKSNMVWWVLGWIFFFPAPVMVLIWRKKNKWDTKKKIAATVAFWVVLFILGNINNSNSTDNSAKTTVEEQVATKDIETTVEEKGVETKENITTEDQKTDIKEEPSEKVEKVEEDDGVSKEYKNALKKADAYASSMNMSKKGVYDQLTSEYGEKFPEDAAQYAIDNVKADWKENALKKAELYSSSMYMSKMSIYDQLVSEYGEQFTPEEAQYAIDNIKADWNANALEKAKTYQNSMNMSNSAIYDQLVSDYGEKFTAEEAQYAIDHLE